MCKKCGIYSITNKKTGQKYIGQSRDIYKRWEQHIKKPNHTYISRAIQKHSPFAFDFKIEEECEPEELNTKEIYYINKYDTYENENHYNLTPGGNCTIPTEKWRLHNKIHFKQITNLDLPLYRKPNSVPREYNLPVLNIHGDHTWRPPDESISNWKTMEYDEEWEPLIKYDAHRDEVVNIKTGEVIQ